MHTLKTAAVLVSLFAATASAENRFCIGGDLQQLSSVQRTVCQTKLSQVRAAVAQNRSLENWHFVVVCDDAGWTDYAAFSSHPLDQVIGAEADTDLAQRSTYLRGSRLVGSPDAAQRLVVAELQKVTPTLGTIQIATR